MPYRESIFFPKNYFHIFCRGNEKRNIFLERHDYEHFLLRMKEYKIMHKVSIICYCLMPNHLHLLLRQNTKVHISSFIHRLTVSHSMYFNKHYDRVGHLFQGRFKAKFIPNDEYLLHLSRYIHLNPQKFLDSEFKLKTYPWSSYSEYINNKDKKEGICEKEIILRQFDSLCPEEEYMKFVSSMITDKELTSIKDLIIELD